MVKESLRGAWVVVLLLLCSVTLQAVVGSTGHADSLEIRAAAAGDATAIALPTRGRGPLVQIWHSLRGQQPSDAHPPRERRDAPEDKLDRRGASVASLALGSLGVALLVAGFFLGGLTFLPSILCGILAIVFGAISLRRHRRGYLVNRGMAIAGLVTGIATVAFLLLLVAALIIAFSNF